MKLILPILKIVKRNYGRAGDYRIYCLANRSTYDNETVSGYISKMGKKVKLQMKTHFFDPSEPISIIGFFAICKPACDTNVIREGVAM